ncbi:MAG: hypothetical protein F6K42_25870 [Leptolyngbya sp. SIO1D8]|nr:hypothetical protein [Leptolyngbya sp. SIO1D8]
MSYRKNQSLLEHRRVLTLAREYRSEGYDVTVYPDARELPGPLSKCSLDIVARGEDRVIAVEVRTREGLTLKGLQDLRRMAETIKHVPGWVFELVVTNPRTSHKTRECR